MHSVRVGLAVVVMAVASFGQSAPAPGTTGGSSMPRRERRPGVMGSITAMDDHSLAVKTMDGQTVSVTLTDKTQFRKNRQPAKLADFKVGDSVMIGGHASGENAWQADFVATRSGARGGFSESDNQHFVGGEIKSIDGTQITLSRPDGTKQTVSVDESTSFRKGEESITLADLRAGDHVFCRGDMKNGVFVPSSLTLGDPHMMWRKPANNGSGGAPR